VKYISITRGEEGGWQRRWCEENDTFGDEDGMGRVESGRGMRCVRRVVVRWGAVGGGGVGWGRGGGELWNSVGKGEEPL